MGKNMSSHEIVDIVNAEDEITDCVERHVMREKHLPHRASYMAVLDGNGRFVVEIRTMSKDYAPGLFDACVGGVMQHGEEPKLAAKRELWEELGIDADDERNKFYELGKLRVDYKSGRGFLYAYLYLVKSDAVTIRQKEEVSWIMLLSAKELEALGASCTYDSLKVFEEILKRAARQGLTAGAEYEH